MKKRTCFVLMPFDNEIREVYDQVYKPVCDSNNLACWRVDEIARPGSITKDIVDGIIDADIIIADLTSRNPNVFYELGIAHSVGNKTIMTAQSMDDVPFDISNYRIIFYEQTIAGSKKLADDLQQAIGELTVSLDQTNNPVQEVFGTRAVGPVRKRKPLIQVIDIGRLHIGLKKLIKGEGIHFVEELAKLDLEEMKSKYELGKINLETLVTIILESESSDDIPGLQQFILKNKLTRLSPYNIRGLFRS